MTIPTAIRNLLLCCLLFVASALRAQSEPNPGPGLGNLTYTSGELFGEISRIHPDDGGALGVSTHYGYNLAHMVNGYMVTVFAEDGGGVRGDKRGGIQFYDVSNPRAPRIVKKVWDPNVTTKRMREIHAVCFADIGAQKLMVMPSEKGIQIWDVADVNNPARVSLFEFVNGGDYTDTPWQLMWQHPYVYVATGGNGLYIIDVSDPANPAIATRTSGGPNPIPNGQLGGFPIGPIWAMGNRLIVTSMESSSGFSVLDIGEPTEPQLLDSRGSIPEFYYAPGFDGKFLAFATRQTNARTALYSIADDGAITLESHAASPVVPEQLYASSQDHHVFLGCQGEIVKLDISDPTAPSIVGRGGLTGVSNPDFGQANPFGNLILIGNDHGSGSGFMPHQTEPDATAPVVVNSSPAANAIGVSVCSRVGIAFSDNITLETVSKTSIEVAPQINGSPGVALDGVYTVKFGIVNFTPSAGFQADTTYTVSVKADGVTDWSGNAITADHQFSFRTGNICGQPTISQPTALKHHWNFNSDSNDSVGTLHGTLTNGASLVDGALNLDGINDHVALPGSLSALQDTSSLAFYLRTNQVGTANSWSSPGVTGVEIAGSGGDIFWGWLDAGGRLNLSAGNGNRVTTTSAINDNLLRHFILTRDATTGMLRIYINGVLNASNIGEKGAGGGSFSSLGRIEDNGGAIDHLRGTLDEIRVYDYVLDSNDVATVFSQSQASLVNHQWKLRNDLLDSIGSLNGSTTGSPVHAEGGLQFDGVNDHVVLGGGQQSNNWSLSLFVKRTGSADKQVILNGGSGTLHLSQPGTGNKLGFTTSSNNNFNWDYSAPLNSWVHLVFVRETNATTTLYADGVSQGNVAGWLDMPLTNLGAEAGGASNSTSVATDIPKSISPSSSNTVTSNLTTTGLAGTLTDVNVSINVNHTWDADLDITLIHPDGTRIELTSDNGGNGDHYSITTFDQQAGMSITAGSPPFNGTYKPEGNLDLLNGKFPNGQWKLEVHDDSGGDGGSLNGWSINLTTSGSSTTSGHIAAILDDITVFPVAIDAAGVIQLRTSFAINATPPATTELGNPSLFTGSATSGTAEPTYIWDFGDGTVTAASYDATTSHTYAQPGHYAVKLTASNHFQTLVNSFTHTVIHPVTAGSPTRSRTIAVNGKRAYCVNIDNDSITAINGEFPFNKLWEQPAGNHPRTLAVAADGAIWVANKEDATLTVHDATSGAIIATHPLPRASRPHGLIIAPDNSAAYVSLEATGQVAKIDLSSGAIDAIAPVGAWPRGLGMTHDSARLFVTRFISPDSGAIITELDPATLATVRSFTLATDTTTVDDSFQARGVANYLNSLTISPDGTRAWFPSKKDNIIAGIGRDGRPLTFETTVRPITSTIDIDSNAAAAHQFIDFNDVGLPVDVEFSQNGSYAFVAIEGSNQVEIRDVFTGVRRGGVNNTGLAPRGLATTADGRVLFVHHFMDRSVKVYDIAQVRDGIGFNMPELGQISTVAAEKLASTVLTGKKIFYNSGDGRMAKDAYISCASCHDDGGHDGRTWDFTQRNEGLRNTTTLRGQAGMGHGRVHWTGNFDEIQDFEHDIRGEFAGIGFLTDAEFNTDTRNTPLGTPKAGVSADLDALADYVASLDSIPTSPHRASDGSMTAAALRGREAFLSLNCYTCHDGDVFTDSPSTPPLHDVGTILPHSGTRMGAPLTGFDTPTLKGIWNTAPYLHDGSAATLLDVIITRNPAGQHGAVSTLNVAQRDDLLAYLSQLDDSETAAPGYDRWKHDHYGLDQVLAGTASQKTGDDDGDHNSNFMEYVFGTNPNDSSDTAATAFVSNPTGGFSLSYEVLTAAEAEANILSQTSTTLEAQSWSNLMLPESDRIMVGDKTQITLEIPAPGPEDPRRFFRLNVEPAE